MASLYIHIPFCQKKCFYCSFVVAVAQEQRANSYLSALEAEARLWQGTAIETLYIGGGTPTLLESVQLRELFKMIRNVFAFPSPALEITIEANPEKLNREKIQTLLELGVNRVSLGVQTFNDNYLKFLGRVHDSQRALRAFADLREVGFKNISIDLMYGFPKQTMEEIDEDLAIVRDLDPEHVSLYTLTIEENSRFHVQKIDLPDQQLAGQYEFVARRLEEIGYAQYEVSNFAKPGYASKHNINYWLSGNYIGLGVGAHSHQNGQRWWNQSRFAEYIACLQHGTTVVEQKENLTMQQRLTESLLFGLRMNQGVNVQELQERFGCVLTQQQKEKIQEFAQDGFLQANTDGFLCVTQRGRLVLDELATYLV